MINIKEKEMCMGCTTCANICPVNAIEMQADKEGFLYPKVDMKKCIGCNLCNKKCPKLNCEDNKAEIDLAYAAYNKNDDVRKVSSSGGLFALLAEKILLSGGKVYAASYDADFHVRHISIDTVDELFKVVGSKYVQSNLGNVYKDIKGALSNRQKVMFVGTHCQVEGLKSYLGNHQETELYCVDIICLGVPSEKIWDIYRKAFIPNKKIRDINFKDKTFGWNKFHINFRFIDNQELLVRGFYSEYMQSYFRRYNMRPSCYGCQFKTRNRKSDITLADCWGISEFANDMNDNKGCSSVIIHTKKGKELFESVKESLVWRQIPIDKVIKGNPNYIISAKKPKLRGLFWIGIQKFPRITLIIFGNSIILRSKETIKRLIAR